MEAVHRLSDLGVVVTHTARGISQEDFGAEWRMIDIFTVDGDLISRLEMFDEADLNAALATFDELQPRAPRLENAASRVYEHYKKCFAGRDWAAMARILTEDIFTDDRRRVVNAGVLQGRDVVLADMRALAEVGANITSAVIAAREERLLLCRVRFWGQDQRPQEFIGESLSIIETDADGRITAGVVFDPDDLDAAFEELEARYLAGEGAVHAHTWSVVAGAYASFNRHELPATAPNSVAVEHRPLLTTETADLAASIRSVWDSTPNARMCIEAVHRLSELGAVVTYVLKGTSPEGFDAEWRMINILTVEGDLMSRSEVFDEADLDAALARFEELQPQAPRLENAASGVGERQLAHFAARDWAAMAEILADDTFTDDRRRVVNAGIQHGRDVDVATMRALADLGVAHIASTVVATRGERLALTRARMSGRDQRPDAFYTEALSILEIDADNRGAAKVVFDPDDIDAAIAELDARYLAGEGAAHARTWSVMMQACAALNTREIFATTADFVNIDHRSLAAIESGDLKPYIRTALNDGVYNVYIEAVHRLDDLGAVVTLVSNGTSQGGFDGEWRMADVFTVEGDLISRCEIFDEADLDAALARFEELDRPAPP